jgi:hypothetical protein
LKKKSSSNEYPQQKTMATLNQKLMISLGSAAIFILVNLPQTYNLTNSLFGGIVGPLSSGGCATALGLVVHAVVFYLLSRLSMSKSYGSTDLKHRRALIATVIMLVLSSPTLFKFVRSILGNTIASATGCPTTQGIFVHGAVYTAILVLLMDPRFNHYF